MRLDSFLLADNATVAEGKLYVHGGGITRINALSLPLAMQLTVAIRLLVEDADVGNTSQISIVVTDPDDSMVLPPAALQLGVEPPGPEMLPDEEQFLQLALGMGLQFTRAGTYHVRLIVNDEPLRDLALPVATLSPEEFQRMAQQQQQPPTPQPNRAQRRAQAHGPKKR